MTFWGTQLSYKFRTHRSRANFRPITFVIAVVIVLIAGLVASLTWYNLNLRPADQAQTELVSFDVKQGQTAIIVADRLAAQGLIRSATAFKIHVGLNDLNQSLQAGSFQVSASWSASRLANHLATAPNEDHQQLTLPPGQRLDEISAILRDAGFSEEAVNQALDGDSYPDHPLLAQLPALASLEGYIFPETFFISQETTALEVIRKSLDEFWLAITTNNLLEAYQVQGLDLHQAVTLASIIEKEVGQSYRLQAAQVFLKRWRAGGALGADATFYYAAAVFGGTVSPDLDNPYNTRRYPGLPPGPIANPSLSSLKSVASPSPTNYYFFVSGDNGQTYFNETLEGHLRDTELYCHELCQLPAD